MNLAQYAGATLDGGPNAGYIPVVIRRVGPGTELTTTVPSELYVDNKLVDNSWGVPIQNALDHIGNPVGIQITNDALKSTHPLTINGMSLGSNNVPWFNVVLGGAFGTAGFEPVSVKANPSQQNNLALEVLTTDANNGNRDKPQQEMTEYQDSGSYVSAVKKFLHLV